MTSMPASSQTAHRRHRRAHRRPLRLAVLQPRHGARAARRPALVALRDMAVLWISMSACVPTYMLASA